MKKIIFSVAVISSAILASCSCCHNNGKAVDETVTVEALTDTISCDSVEEVTEMVVSNDSVCE